MALEPPNQKHPELGRIKLGLDGWFVTARFPAFRTFRYRGQGRQRGRLLIDIDLGEDEDAPPGSAELALAARIVKNQDDLARKLRQAIWRDLRGQGPHSGMWWHGDLSRIQQQLASGSRRRIRLDSPEDLDRVLFVSDIVVGYGFYRPEGTPARILMYSAYEREHGLGVLTDGRSILGIGYSSDVEPFHRKH